MLSPSTSASTSLCKKDIFVFIKMKTIFLVLTLAIVGAIAKPAEKNPLEPISKKSVSETTSTSEASVSSQDIKRTEADFPEINEILIDDEKQSNYGTTFDVFMEENLNSPSVLDQDIVPDFVGDIDDRDEIVYHDVLNRDPNEIMDTAAGFLPVPIIRRKSNRRFATRRNFRRNPYPRRRVFYYYPSYGFYPRSSLRYY